ncbi:MAG: Abi family protein [[Actinobacillus] rossii]|nr:Abi family protein [[Actinobacillus] rossii]MDY5792843.1 Abi family protein [[Actinobacillus] rossii]
MTIKPHKEYPELVEQLKSRGMTINDPKYAEKKLSQVGYYRLSGFWHISRKPNPNNSLSDEFLDNVVFEEVYKLYIFDKKLRLLLLDIIERLEINIRTIIAHELGRDNPLAYQDYTLINHKFLKHQWKNNSYAYAKWLDSVSNKIQRCKDEFIEWHKANDKELPFWVITETWDFGTMSKFYSLLNGQQQRKIAKQFNIDENTLKGWLNEINIVRNLSAHHSRVWNKSFTDIVIPDFSNPRLAKFKKANAYFDKVELDQKSKARIFSRIVVLWYLVSQTSTNYHWLDKFGDLLKSFPNLPNAKIELMGISDNNLELIYNSFSVADKRIGT